MREKARGTLLKALLAASLVYSLNPIFSGETATIHEGILFALARLGRNSAVEIRDSRGKILICGNVLEIEIGKDSLRITTEPVPELLPDCAPAADRREARISIAAIEFMEILTPQAEYYVYSNDKWRSANWLRPLKRGKPAFGEATDETRYWQRYSRPPRYIPGVFWPEVRMSTGAYFLTKTRDSGLPVALALDFRIHRLLYPLSLSFDFAYASRLNQGDTTLTSPTAYSVFTASLVYAALSRAAWSASITLGGGGIYYALGANAAASEGLRSMLSSSVILSWHMLRLNRDFHKFSVFLQPAANLVINRNESSLYQFPWLLELRAGVQYAY